MDLKQLRALLRLLEDHDVHEFRHVEGDTSIELRRGAQPAPAAQIAAAAPVPAAVVAAPAPQAAPAPSPSPEVSGTLIKSPMVGTLYASPSPGAAPFVEVGQRVAIGQTLCIIEAMKLMNEIEADVAGVLVERLVADGSPVEFGQPIFSIRAD